MQVIVNIQGKVQGVFYRKWTVETALKLGLRGWVRNLADGRVEMVISGKSAAVDSMLERCRVGPPAARVHGIDIEIYHEHVDDCDFHVKHTEQE
jgi:acylphosphatase